MTARARSRLGHLRTTGDLHPFPGETAGALTDVHTAGTLLGLRRVKTPTAQSR